MKKTFFLLTILAGVFMSSNSFAGEILGYPVTPTQVRFYALILGLIGFSAGMVSVAYFSFWLVDVKKKKGAVRKIQTCEAKSFGQELAAAAQSAK